MTGPDRLAYSPERLDEAIAQMTRLAEQQSQHVVLCGGLAMQSYGSDRLTKDVDLVCGGLLSGLPTSRFLSFGGIETNAPNGVPVDLIVRDDQLEALYTDALNTAVSRPGIPCKVVSAEHLAAMKLAAMRERDHVDLHYLIVGKQDGVPVLDRAKAKALVRQFVGGWYAERDFDAHCDEAELLALRESRQR